MEKEPEAERRKIATLLGKTDEFKKFPVEVLRQRMRGAKQAPRDYLEDMAADEAKARRKGEL